MIVDNLDFFGAALDPHETDAPLLVDPDAVLALSAPSKELQPISGNCPQIRQRGRAIYHRKLSQRRPLDALKAQHPLPMEQRVRVF
jgi:hypothetical protein